MSNYQNQITELAAVARDYYNSVDADEFYFRVWGGEDIHIGLYESADEVVFDASRRCVKVLSEKLGPSSSDRGVDLGSGYGGAARYLAKTFGCRVECVNVSQTQNIRNREMTVAQGLNDQVSVHEAAFESLPFDDQSFDFAWSQDALLHSGDKPVVMREAYRVLKPGARFIFTDPMQRAECPPEVLRPVLDRLHLSQMGTFDDYRAMAEATGFSVVETQDWTHHLDRHYQRVLEELEKTTAELQDAISEGYRVKMAEGLRHWIEAAANGYLAWGYLLLEKPE